MTVSNVVKFRSRRAEPPGDDAAFVTCHLCGAEEFAVVVRFSAGQPFVSALVCVSDSCLGETEIGAANGFLE